MHASSAAGVIIAPAAGKVSSGLAILPSHRITSLQHRVNVGSTSSTLARHSPGAGPKSLVSRVHSMTKATRNCLTKVFCRSGIFDRRAKDLIQSENCDSSQPAQKFHPGVQLDLEPIHCRVRCHTNISGFHLHNRWYN